LDSYNRVMREHCHRCHGELPDRAAANPYDDEGALLFCPRCGAPQILLPDHMRVEAAEVRPANSTGAMPPPRPAAAAGTVAAGQVDWRAALAAGALVAGVGAVLELIGLKSNAASFLSVLWTMGGAVIALGLYARHRPRAWMDARVGLRVGVATGLVLVAAMGIALAATGVVMRYGTHSLASFDSEVAANFELMRQQLVVRMQEQQQPAQVQQKILGFMGSQEVRAGLAVFYMGLLGGVVVLISAGGGAFAGMMRTSQSPRPGLRRGD